MVSTHVTSRYSITSESPELLAALMTLGYSAEDIKALIKEVEEARWALLGEREDRVKNKNLADFETHWRAKPLKAAERCYGINNMVQQPRRLESTPAALKTYDDDRDPYQMKMNRFNCVRSLSSMCLIFPLTRYLVSAFAS